MADTFYVKSRDGRLIAAKFAQYNGEYISDPNTGVAQSIQIFDEFGNVQENANPNGYLIVPPEYSIGGAITFAQKVSSTLLDSDPYSMINAANLMIRAFIPGGSQDLQRYYFGASGNGGKDFVSAFSDAASFNLGVVAEYSGFGGTAAIIGGGVVNAIQSLVNSKINTSGDYFNRPQNVLSIKAGAGFSASLPGATSSAGGKAWESLKNVLVNAIKILNDSEIPDYVRKILPDEGGSIALQIQSSGDIVVVGKDYTYKITQYYKGMGYDLSAYSSGTTGLSALLGLGGAAPGFQFKSSYNSSVIPTSSTNFVVSGATHWVLDFDANGKPSEKREYVGSSSTPNTRQVYDTSGRIVRVDHLDPGGNIVGQEHFSPDGVSPYLKHSYDDHGREISTDVIDPVTGRYARTDYYNVSAGKVWKSDFYEASTGRRVVVETYDTNSGKTIDRQFLDPETGRVASVLQLYNAETKTDINVTVSYLYDKGVATRDALVQGYILRDVVKLVAGLPTSTVIGRQWRNRDGVLIFNEEYSDDGQHLKYSYSRTGQDNQTAVELFADPTGNVVQKIISNATTGNKETLQLLSPKGIIVAEDKFGSNGKLSERSIRDENNGEERTRYVYNDGGDGVVKQMDFPPGSHYAQRITYFDGHGNQTGFDIFDPITGVKWNLNAPPAGSISFAPRPPRQVTVFPPPKPPTFSTFPNVTGPNGAHSPGTPFYTLPPLYLPTLHPLPGDHLNIGGNLGNWSFANAGGHGTRWEHWPPGSDVPDMNFVVPGDPPSMGAPTLKAVGSTLIAMSPMAVSTTRATDVTPSPLPIMTKNQIAALGSDAQHGTATTVVGGNGSNTIASTDGRAKISLGNGNKAVSGVFEALTLGEGANTVTSTGPGATIDLGGGPDTVTIKGESSAVKVGHGEYDVNFGRQNDKLTFGSDVTADHLWFRRVGSDLDVSVIGTTEKVTLKDWYASTPHQADITAGDGKTLLSVDVEKLVQAMAAFAPPTAGATNLTNTQQTTLQAVLAANWH